MKLSVFCGVSVDGFLAQAKVPHDVSLRHIATRSYKGGLVQTEYEISAEGPQP